jgi:hypothetical protein
MKCKPSLLSAVLIFVTVGISVPARTQDRQALSSDGNTVYEAVLALMDRMPIEDPHITIFGMTLNSKCGEEAGPYIPLADGCTFLWMKPDTANSVKRLLRDEWKDFESSTWSDFETKNAASVRLREPIATPWKHKLIFPEDEPSKDWDSANLAIFLSRVGFNQKKTEAVVYVLVFSYMDQVETAGDYFLFRIGKGGHWEPNGRLTYFTKGKDQAPK